MSAGNETTIGFYMQHGEDGVVLFGGLYGLILVPTEHYGQNAFEIGEWYSVHVQEADADPAGYSFVATSTPVPLDNYPFEVRYENDIFVAKRVPVFVGHRSSGNHWIGMNGFLGRVLVENTGLTQFRPYLFDLLSIESDVFACQWTSQRQCGVPTVQVPAHLVKARYVSTVYQEDGSFHFVFVDEQGVNIAVYEKDITDRMAAREMHETTDLKIVRGAPLRWGYTSVCCYATTDLGFDRSRLEDIVPQFSLDNNSDASSTLPDDPQGSQADVTESVGVDATSEWLRKALALLAETLANPQTSSLITDDVLERITTQLTYRSSAPTQQPSA
ncbi:hypothetical protein AAVH_12676 [Aphelenchoides avenae]|nr:hypothetical protein AAVH_12676 [Aphelenchus avenae]